MSLFRYLNIGNVYFTLTLPFYHQIQVSSSNMDVTSCRNYLHQVPRQDLSSSSERQKLQETHGYP